MRLSTVFSPLSLPMNVVSLRLMEAYLTSRQTAQTTLFLAFVLLLTACANEPKIKTHHAPQQTIPQATVQVTPITKPEHEKNIAPPEQPKSMFLQGLSNQDLDMVMQEARRATLPHWPYIETRAQRFHARVLKTLQDMNAPQELLFIPVVESGYNPYALSPAGAFGLWQLMPRTAIELGAIHRHGVDGRRHIEKSTQAAVSYLLSLYERFNSWTLALAAYNLGPWGVQRRLNKTPWQPEMGISALPFPAETKHYVKQILGLIALHEQGEIAFSEPIPTRIFHAEYPADLNQIEQASGLSKHEIFHLNPGFDYQHYLRHNITLHLPQNNIQVLEKKLQQEPHVLKPKHIQVKIRKGDSLWKIARRHNTSIAYLRRINPKLHHTLSIGSLITVPASNTFATATSKTNPLLAQGRRIRYKVKSGDSLWKIAKKFGTSTKSIARINQISVNKLLRPGDRLWIVARFRPS